MQNVSVIADIPQSAGFDVDVADTVATITLNRPDQLNPQTPDTWRWLRRVGADLPGTVRVVVVRGRGRAFSAGLDRALVGDASAGLLGIARQDDATLDATIAEFQEGFGWLARPDLVSIAAVQGYAIGGGFQLALACDLRIAADDAQFAMAEPMLGIVPDLGGTKRLVELVGYGAAAGICLTGRRVPADEALRLGLVTAVVPGSDLDGAVTATVQAVLALPRDAVAETKALLQAAALRSQDEQEAAERLAQARRLRDLAGIERED